MSIEDFHAKLHAENHHTDSLLDSLREISRLDDLSAVTGATAQPLDGWGIWATNS